MTDQFRGFWGSELVSSASKWPQQTPKLSIRTLGHEIEETLMGRYTRTELETVLADELHLAWEHDSSPSDGSLYSKRSLIDAYMDGWGVPQMAALARRIITELDISDTLLVELQQLLDIYDAGGGVTGPTKNLIFAANGPKPDIVLRDAISNDIEIVKNAEYCLVYEDQIPAEGLRFSTLTAWWSGRSDFGRDADATTVGRNLHGRLRASLDNDAERLVFDTYAARYRESFDIPALIPQVYLHYDPYTQRSRKIAQSVPPLARQRMDFLLLFSDRRRVVIEVDGKQHYAKGDRADPELYSQMVAEDRKLRLAGYEVYRFGGFELLQDSSRQMLETFFAQLADRMA